MDQRPTSKQIFDNIIDSIRERKGQAITVIDLSANESAAASEFVICQGRSSTQVDAIADNIREQLLERLGVKPYNYDGYANSQWIIIDYGDTMVHVFQPEVRLRYNLEELWSDATVYNLPDED
ncbi:MAG: ribosome silencing factor [Muribaculaceae bacterium]|nr:ribosome silencing factor [Muribaculaceae bacterium]